MGGRRNARYSAVRGATVDTSLYVRISLVCEGVDSVQMINGSLLEYFFRSNLLLSFGALGYSECRLNTISSESETAHSIIQVPAR
ncbi:hypothetical protein BOVATA_029260 [Babesia ovata]|uniref:Uncharacterized protein n=1 Tax=Babesia ovata TaxID=189622 RepID=A0A2H6KEL5_9APIC|nr:uncharacterized protein BOVATA_029260 [Babesia ovata]GBE61433.1 hypothetical protein BOVATA_029260 [Babesia ovata]